MSAMQRRKGATGERELAAEIHAATGWNVQRRCRQHEGDSDLEGVPGWSVESKRHATATPGQVAAWWRQTVEQAERAGERPVLFYRQNRGAWRACWPLSALLAPAEKWHDIEMTIEGSVTAWAAVARELAPGGEPHAAGQPGASA